MHKSIIKVNRVWTKTTTDVIPAFYKYMVKHESGFTAGSENCVRYFKQKKNICNCEEWGYGLLSGLPVLCPWISQNWPAKGTALCAVIQRVGNCLLSFWVQENMVITDGPSMATSTSWPLWNWRLDPRKVLQKIIKQPWPSCWVQNSSRKIASTSFLPFKIYSIVSN